MLQARLTRSSLSPPKNSKKHRQCPNAGLDTIELPRFNLNQKINPLLRQCPHQMSFQNTQTTLHIYTRTWTWCSSTGFRSWKNRHISFLVGTDRLLRFFNNCKRKIQFSFAYVTRTTSVLPTSKLQDGKGNDSPAIPHDKKDSFEIRT